MNYVLILGNSYSDCKAKFNSIKKQSNTKYTYVTKIKHLKQIPFSDYIETDEFKNNPNANNILNKIKKTGAVKHTPEPVEQPKEKDKSQLEISFEEPQENINIPVDNSENTEQTPDPEEDINIPVDNSENTEQTPDPEEDILSEEESFPFPADKLDNEFKEMEDSNDIIKEETTSDVLNSEDSDDTEIEINEDSEEVADESDITNPDVGEDIEEQEMNVKDIKPVGYTPRGWHARKEFIDEEGNIFHKGVYVGNMKDHE